MRTIRYVCSAMALSSLVAAVWTLAQGYTLFLEGWFAASACLLGAVLFWLIARDPRSAEIGSPENKSRVLFAYHRS